MNILVLAGDYYHPDDVIRAGLAPLEGEAFHFTFSGMRDDFFDFDAVVLCKSDRVSAEDERTFMAGDFSEKLATYVRNGGGLLAVHAGTVAPKASQLLRDVIGCQFDHHPAQCPVTFEPKEHLLCEGVSAFTQQDEHYFLQMFAQDADVFLESTSDNGRQVAGYLRREGVGRVAVLTPGHLTPVWLDPQMQTLLMRTIAWCAEGSR